MTEGDAPKSAVSSLGERIIAAASSAPADDLIKVVGESSLEKITEALNELLQEGMLQVLQAAGGAITFTVADQATAKLKGLGPEDRLIYQMIEDAGVNGIWIRYLKSRSSIQQTRLTRILQVLERKKLIKERTKTQYSERAVKTPDGGKKRVYMLYDLNPPVKFDFQPDKMALYTQKARAFIDSKGYANIEEISAYLQNAVSLPEEMGKVELTQDNVQSIIDTLVYDGTVEDFKAPLEQRGRRAGATLYKPARLSVAQLWSSHDRMPLGGLTEAPCGTCPVFDKCSDEGDVTPNNCPYLAEWFKW